jgi:phage host-nuclease inhibitor protein Gam
MNEVINIPPQVEWTNTGVPYNPDTGEVISEEELARYGIEIPNLPFTIHDDDTAEWALEKLAKYDAEYASYEARLEALSRNLQSMMADVEARRKWWRTRFAPELESYAAAKLDDLRAAGKKPTKTVKFAWGRVSFRTSKGTNAITKDRMADAVAWMEEVDPTKVKIKKEVTVTDVLATLKAEGVKFNPPWIESTGPREVCDIKTGVLI